MRGEDGRIACVRYVLPRHKAANWGGPGRGRKSTRPGANGVVELSRFDFLYGSYFIIRRDPPGSADGSDVFPAKRPVAPDGFLDEGLLVGVGAIAPEVLAEPVPKSFNRIEFR